MKSALDLEMEALLAESQRLATPRPDDRQRISSALRARLGPGILEHAATRHDSTMATSGVPPARDAAVVRGGATASARRGAALSRSAWLRVVVLTAVGSGLIGFALGYAAGGTSVTASTDSTAIATTANPSSASPPSSVIEPSSAPAPTVGTRANSPTPADDSSSSEATHAAGPARGERTDSTTRRARSTPARTTRVPGRASAPRPGDPSLDGASPSASSAAPTDSAAPLDGAAPSDRDEWAFSEVLEHLRRAHLALGQGQASLALVQLAEIDRHAGATLLEERAMTRALTLCALGEEAAARQAAQPLLAGEARSIYAQRLEQSCASPP